MTRTTLAAWMLLAAGISGCEFRSGHGVRNPLDYDIGAARSGSVSEIVVRAEPIRDILSRDAQPMLDGLNELGVENPHYGALSVLISAWNGSQQQEPDLNWDAMDRLDVRFALAEELARA